MKKYLWILGIVFFGGLAAFALFATGSFNRPEHKSYEPAPLTFVIDWEISKPVVLQVIYIKDKKDVFSQKNSVWKHVNPEDKHVELVIPAERIYNFRVDFKSKPGKMVIKNIEIKGDMYLNFNHWEDYRYANMDKTKINDDNQLEIYSEQDDPHMVFLYPFVLDEKVAKSGEQRAKLAEKKIQSDKRKVKAGKKVAEPSEETAAVSDDKASPSEEAALSSEEVKPNEKVAPSGEEVAKSDDTANPNEETAASGEDTTEPNEEIAVNQSGMKPIIPAKKPVWRRIR